MGVTGPAFQNSSLTFPIIEHPFFSDISWDNIRNHCYKYDKQAFLKMDLLGTNFNTDHI